MPIQKKYNKNFFKTWSHDMAYVLGFLYADGNIVKSKRETHFVALYTADRILLDKIKKILKSEHKISVRKSVTGEVYRLQIGSKEWFDDLQKIGLTPHKASRMCFPVIPHEYFGSFVRGYFDGDGNVWVGLINKKRPTPTRVVYAAFTSASSNFLRALKRELEKAGVVRGGSLYVSKVKNFSRLTFSTVDALKIYKIMYTGRRKPYLERKKTTFERFIINRSSRSSTG